MVQTKKETQTFTGKIIAANSGEDKNGDSIYNIVIGDTMYFGKGKRPEFVQLDNTVTVTFSVNKSRDKTFHNIQKIEQGIVEQGNDDVTKHYNPEDTKFPDTENHLVMAINKLTESINNLANKTGAK